MGPTSVPPQMPFKVLLILPLVFAAAVLVPLRRAQRAFPVRSQLAGISAAPRALMRRRPSSPRAVLNPVRMAARILAQPPVTADGVTGEAARRGVSVSKALPLGGKRFAGAFAGLRPGPTLDDHDGGGDRMVDCVDSDIHLRPPGTPRPNPSTAVAVRPAADVPVPPPKASV